MHAFAQSGAGVSISTSSVDKASEEGLRRQEERQRELQQQLETRSDVLTPQEKRTPFTEQQAANAYEKKDDKRLAALYGAKAGLTLYSGVQGTDAPPAGATEPPKNSAGAAIKFTVSVGSKSADSQSEVGSTTNQGSTLTAGETVSLIATGNGGKDADGNGRWICAETTEMARVDSRGSRVGMFTKKRLTARERTSIPLEDIVGSVNATLGRWTNYFHYRNSSIPSAITP
jgi:hypothetical protein